MAFPTLLKSSALALFLLIAVGAGGLSAGPQDGTSVQGELLVAAPSMGDPRFYHAVILMVHDTEDGAMGIIINRPVGERPLAEILGATGDKAAGIKGQVRVFAGGPVQPQLGFVIHSPDYRRDGTMAIDAHVSMTADKQILRDIAGDRGPAKRLVAFGYAGWGPGQLQREMAHNDWYTAPDDPALLFDLSRERVWDEAMARRLREL